jgi:TRAP-type C4-dicarboxylate transport system permease small subunit
VRSLITILGIADRILTVILKWLTIVLFLALTVIVTANILLRLFPVTSLHWSDEIVEMSFAALVFYGAAGVWMVKGHFSVGDWISRIVRNERARGAYRLLLELISLLFAGVLCYYSLILVIRAREVTAVFQIPKAVLYSAMPVSALIMVAYSIVNVVRAVIAIVDPKALAAAESGATKARRPAK